MYIENGQESFFIIIKCFAREIRNNNNSGTKCPFDFDLNFILCSSELNAILLVPNKDITHFIVRFFLVHLWAWAWPVRP